MSESDAIEIIKRQGRSIYDSFLCRGNSNYAILNRDDALALRTLKAVILEMGETDVAKDFDVLIRRVRSNRK